MSRDSTEEPGPALPARAKVVMIVEDDVEIRESLAELLESWALVTVAVNGGESALRTLREGGCQPSVILLDLKMSGLSGWGFRRQQMIDATLSKVPVVIMTALPIPTGSARDEFGDVAWLRKPFSLDDLRAALASALEGR